MSAQESVPRTDSAGKKTSTLRRPLLSGLRTWRSDLSSNMYLPADTTPDSWRRHSAPSLSSPSSDDAHHHSLEHAVKDFKGRLSTILARATLAIFVYFGVGILAYYGLGKFFGIQTKSATDALYFCVVTLTLVGYGDIVPSTVAGKLFTCVYVFVGFSLVSVVLNTAADYIVQKQEQVLVQSIRSKERPVYEEPQIDEAYAASSKALLAGMLVVALLFSGTMCLIFVEGMTLVDALYCVCVTVTTLGYGDQSFHTEFGRFFAALWILTSTISLARFLLYVAEMRVANRQRTLAHWVLHRRTTRPDLEAADLDCDGVVSAPEFVIFKLKELGKITEKDVVGILREFQELDYDRSGAISISDLSLSQANSPED